MPGNISDTVKDSVLLLFKDRILLLFAVIFAAINAAIAYLSVDSVFSDLSSVLTSSATGALGALPVIIGVLERVIVVDIIAGLLSLFFILVIMTRAFYGQKKHASQVLVHATGRYLYALALVILVAVAVSVPFVILVALAVLAAPLIVLLLLYMIGLAYVLVRISVAFPFVVSGNGPVSSLKMSWDATKGNWWYVFLSYLLVAIALWIVVAIFEVPWIFGVIGSSVASVHAAGSNVTKAQSTALVLNAEQKAYSSPYFFVITFVSSLLNFWFAILPVMVYMQLVGNAAKSSRRARKQA